MNKWMGIGRFGKDPELSTTTTGKKVCRFSLAVERKFQREGERATDWLDFVAWNSAEFIAKHFAKGDSIYIEGELQTNVFEGKDGKKHKRFEVVVENAEFLPSGGSAN